MPEIKPEKILSFSSEDELYPVTNLLKCSSVFPWKCKLSSETKGFVEFKFKSPVKFSRIEIGNNSSAFIEIKVSKSSNPNEYEVLLASTSLMSPSEAIKCENLSRVRCFKASHFYPAVALLEWDIVKMECSQPLNKTLQFGLSFIRFQIEETNSTEDITEQKDVPYEPKIDISKFMSVNYSQLDSYRPGSLFQSRIISVDSESTRTAIISNIHEKTIPGTENRNSSKKSDNKRKLLVPINNDMSIRDVQPNLHSKKIRTDHSTGSNDASKVDIPIVQVVKDVSLVESKEISSKNSSQHHSKARDSLASTSCSQSIDIVNDHSQLENQVLRGVIFTLSGYQNPLRNTLRDKAISLGGKYRPNWTNDCTHLICAFNNTPKFNEVLGKGVIVSDKWILECYKQKKMLPWRNYRLKGAVSPIKIIKNDGVKTPNDSPPPGKVNMPIKKENDSVPDKIMDQDPNGNKTTELLHLDNQMKDNIESLKKLPVLFAEKHFFIYGDFDKEERRFIYRFIVTFGGLIHDYMSPLVNIVVTNLSWNDNFEEALCSNPKLKFVRSSWINSCDENQSMVPFGGFEITK